MHQYVKALAISFSDEEMVDCMQPRELVQLSRQSSILYIILGSDGSSSLVQALILKTRCHSKYKN